MSKNPVDPKHLATAGYALSGALCAYPFARAWGTVEPVVFGTLAGVAVSLVCQNRVVSESETYTDSNGKQITVKRGEKNAGSALGSALKIFVFAKYMLVPLVMVGGIVAVAR